MPRKGYSPKRTDPPPSSIEGISIGDFKKIVNLIHHPSHSVPVYRDLVLYILILQIKANKMLASILQYPKSNLEFSSPNHHCNYNIVNEQKRVTTNGKSRISHDRNNYFSHSWTEKAGVPHKNAEPHISPMEPSVSTMPEKEKITSFHVRACTRRIFWIFFFCTFIFLYHVLVILHFY